MKLPRKDSPFFLPKIYRAGSRKGAVLFWQAEVLGSRWRAHSGQEGGAEKIGAWSQAGATNEGKANARTAEEQARFYAEAKQAKLLEYGGYFLDRTRIGQQQFVAPMLAHVFDADDPPAFPLSLQPKLNGFRCVITSAGMFSRRGKEFYSAPHIFRALAPLFKRYPSLVLDGELYNHDYRLKLNQISSLVRVKRPTKEDLAESERIVQFHCYDLFFLGDEKSALGSMSFGNRTVRLSRLLPADFPFIVLVPTHQVPSMLELAAFYQKYLSEGYEGVMLRDNSAAYVRGARTTSLLKYKPRFSAEFRLKKFYEGNGKRKGMAASVSFEVEANKTYEGGFKTTAKAEGRANIKWSDEEKRSIWNRREKLEGTIATISYAYITEYNIPFQPYVELLHESKKRKL